jgi:ASC-1-like (ASCH) protein
MTHKLKILPEYYEQVLSGEKKFELRKNDRDYKTGDMLRIREWNKTYYTGRTFICEIKYILKDCPDYGLKNGFVILGIA